MDADSKKSNVVFDTYVKTFTIKLKRILNSSTGWRQFKDQDCLCARLVKFNPTSISSLSELNTLLTRVHFIERPKS